LYDFNPFTEKPQTLRKIFIWLLEMKRKEGW
jgi:hypothetical protein